MTRDRQRADGSPTKQVGIAEYTVVTDDTQLSTSGVGSCLGIVLRDSFSDVSGLIHVMLPTAAESRDGNPTKFVDTGLPLLIEEMVEAGASKRRLEGWVVGGSEMLSFSSDGDSIGSRNIAAAKQAFKHYGIDVVGTDVGGSHGRSIRFDPADEAVTIQTADDSTTQTI